MRRAALLLTLFVAFVPSSYATGAPVVRAVTMQPFRVRGSNFRPAERVTVRVVVEGAARVHVLRAASTGTFTTTFTAVSIGNCTAYLVTARGSGGSRAMLRRNPLFVDCAQP
jgi:hypothetical protein